jgi:hypothetical protein
MKVVIKSFDVDMEVKSKGIEFEVDSPDGTEHLGDLVLTKTVLTWCKGRTTPAKGIKIKWEDFAEWAESRAPKKAKGK